MIDKTIAADRTGISKSLMTDPCELRAWYSETVRDERGWRLRNRVPERVAFGSAVDSAHAYIVWHIREGLPWTREDALRDGMARIDPEWVEIDDWPVFRLQVANAIELFLSQPNGLARLEPYIPGIRMQGMDGQSIEADGGIGTPDYVTAGWSVIDVKCSHASYPVPDPEGAPEVTSKFWKSAEMPFYGYLVSRESGGVVPPRLIYQVYVRTQKPQWKWYETPGTGDLVELGRLHLERWTQLLGRADPVLFRPDTTYCNGCAFRQPLPEYGHEGCRVGLLMPQEEEAA